MHVLTIEIEQIEKEAEQLKREKSADLIPPAHHLPKPAAQSEGMASGSEGSKATEACARTL
jgi:hypothetical protein